MDAKPEIPSYFGFDDVHAFKDYLGMVLCCAPDLFIEEEWLPPDQQMNLERALKGCGTGLIWSSGNLMGRRPRLCVNSPARRLWLTGKVTIAEAKPSLNRLRSCCVASGRSRPRKVE